MDGALVFVVIVLLCGYRYGWRRALDNIVRAVPVSSGPYLTVHWVELVHSVRIDNG